MSETSLGATRGISDWLLLVCSLTRKVEEFVRDKYLYLLKLNNRKCQGRAMIALTSKINELVDRVIGLQPLLVALGRY